MRRKGRKIESEQIRWCWIDICFWCFHQAICLFFPLSLYLQPYYIVLIQSKCLYCFWLLFYQYSLIQCRSLCLLFVTAWVFWNKKKFTFLSQGYVRPICYFAFVCICIYFVRRLQNDFVRHFPNHCPYFWAKFLNYSTRLKLWFFVLIPIAYKLCIQKVSIICEDFFSVKINIFKLRILFDAVSHYHVQWWIYVDVVRRTMPVLYVLAYKALRLYSCYFFQMP